MYHKAWTGNAWQADWENLGGAFYTALGGASGSYPLLVIAPDEFMPALQPLLQHKNQSGMPAIAVSISSLTPAFQGIDAPETIKNAIRCAHESLSTQYVMLVGDAHWFPVRFMFMHSLVTSDFVNDGADITPFGDYLPSDLYYANLYHHTGVYPSLAAGTPDNWDANGNGLYNEGTWGDPNALTTSNPDNVDGYPDVAVGRIPAHSVQDVAWYVTKVIGYESRNSTSVPFVFVGDGIYGDLTDTTQTIVGNSGLMGSTLVTARYLLIENNGNTPSPWVNASAADVENAAMACSWMSYLGHGGPQGWGQGLVFTPANVAATAGSKAWPVVFGIGCSTGEFIMDFPWNGEYIDVSGVKHNFQPGPGAQSGGSGSLIVDTDTGQSWGANCSGCQPLPWPVPTPSAYDFDRSDLCFAYPWLIASAPGGAIAYFGEVGIATDPMGAELESYVLAAYTREESPILGYIYLNGQQQYWGAHQKDTGNSGDYHSVSRFYLGWMTFFGDPSLRLPKILNLT